MSARSAVTLVLYGGSHFSIKANKYSQVFIIMKYEPLLNKLKVYVII